MSWSFLPCWAEGSRTKCHPLDHTADITEPRRRKTSRREVGGGRGRACCRRASRPTHQSVLASSGGLLGVFLSHKHTQTPTSSPLSSTYSSGVQAAHHIQSRECLPCLFLNQDWREKVKGWRAKDAARQNRHEVPNARQEARFSPLKRDLFRNELNCQIAIIASFLSV